MVKRRELEPVAGPGVSWLGHELKRRREDFKAAGLPVEAIRMLLLGAATADAAEGGAIQLAERDGPAQAILALMAVKHLGAERAALMGEDDLMSGGLPIIFMNFLGQVRRCYVAAASVADLSKLEWAAPEGIAIDDFISEIADEAKSKQRRRAISWDTPLIKTLAFLRDLGLSEAKARFVFDESMLMASELGTRALDQPDNNKQTDDVTERIVAVIPHFRLALLTAGCSEEQATRAVKAMYGALVEDRLGDGPKIQPNISPSANLQEREQALWRLALDREGGSVRDRGRALTALGHLYRVAAEASGKSKEATRKRPGRPQEGTDEDLLDIIVNPDLGLEIRHRAVKALHSRWQRSVEKSRK